MSGCAGRFGKSPDSLRAGLRPTPPLGVSPLVLLMSGGYLRAIIGLSEAFQRGAGGGCSSSSAWNQSYRDTETWGGESPAWGSQAVELLPGARFRIPVQNPGGALGSGLVGRDPPAPVSSSFPDPPAGDWWQWSTVHLGPLPERYPGISAPGPDISAQAGPGR